jgi:predicted ATPase
MIRKVEIEGYRSLRSIKWEPGPLNIIIGPNCSGKSNLLFALHHLKNAADGNFFKTIMAENGMGSVVWNNEKNGSIRMRVDLDPVHPGYDQDPLRGRVTYELVFRRIGSTSDYTIVTDRLGQFYRYDNKEQAEPYLFLARDKGNLQGQTKEEKKLKKIGELSDKDWNEPVLSQMKGVMAKELLGVTTTFHKIISEWFFALGIRVDADSPIRTDTVSDTVQEIYSDGSNLIQFLHTLYMENQIFKDDLDSALRAAFGDDFVRVVFPPTAASRIQMKMNWRHLTEAQPTFVLSDGTLRYLYLLAVLMNPEPPPLIFIDEPEIGLHPSMLSLVAEAAVDASERTQVILTTHSPQFLDHFSDHGDVVSVMYLEEGQSRIRRLTNPILKKWLGKYKYGELMTSGELDELAHEEEELV